MVCLPSGLIQTVGFRPRLGGTGLGVPHLSKRALCSLYAGLVKPDAEEDADATPPASPSFVARIPGAARGALARPGADASGPRWREPGARPATPCGSHPSRPW